ncbi:alpha/beta hydrolase [Vagococcus jeotgali]|uniref:alpha/beta hydrolase n=1 Tax=Vagococcus jeotgali TaxID=3109030 RepID=UPI002DD8C900|nr:alpha/beta hydrolase [Vagococcus sp. B2T-5]
MTILLYIIIFFLFLIIISTLLLFKVAFIPGKKVFLNNIDNSKELEKAWEFSYGKEEELKIKSHDQLTLVGRLIKHKKENKELAIVIHGYMGEAFDMARYAKLFYDKGLDVLLPDNRAHGESEGDYISFGWSDRLDYLLWVELMIELYGEDINIVLFGVSMGAATAMMLSGEDLPKQVRCIIEDCGYDSVENQLSYQLKRMFKLPKYPLIPVASWYTKHKIGFKFSEADCVRQLKKNQLPTLFIHGDKDRFVPFDMVYNVYEATQGDKELVVFEGSRHATSLSDAPKKYDKAISVFLDKYFVMKD